jgi:small subunit ribosomal protein S4
MARYTGPVCKLCRRAGIKLFLKGDRCFSQKCAMESNRKPYAPGSAGQGRRRKMSEFGIQLREKQKARHTYGVLERQFRRHFEEAERRPGSTGENLLRILEMRLDNAVYRLGLADTRRQARQLVNHGHIAVNGRKVDIPSYEVKIGDVIEVSPRAKKLEYFKALGEVLKRREVPTWLSMESEAMKGRVLNAPARQDIDANLQEQLIVEYYSR